MLLQPVLGLSNGSDDALESVGHVGEVGDATADDQDLSVGMRMTTHQVNDCLGVFVSLKKKF